MRDLGQAGPEGHRDPHSASWGRTATLHLFGPKPQLQGPVFLLSNFGQTGERVDPTSLPRRCRGATGPLHSQLSCPAHRSLLWKAEL